jgi:hypothetical protein
MFEGEAGQLLIIFTVEAIVPAAYVMVTVISVPLSPRGQVEWIMPTTPSCPEQLAELIAPACIWPEDDKGPWIHTVSTDDDDVEGRPQCKQSPPPLTA